MQLEQVFTIFRRLKDRASKICNSHVSTKRLNLSYQFSKKAVNDANVTSFNKNRNRMVFWHSAFADANRKIDNLRRQKNAEANFF